MTAVELIEHLQQFLIEPQVLIPSYEDGFDPVADSLLKTAD